MPLNVFLFQSFQRNSSQNEPDVRVFIVVPVPVSLIQMRALLVRQPRSKLTCCPNKDIFGTNSQDLFSQSANQIVRMHFFTFAIPCDNMQPMSSTSANMLQGSSTSKRLNLQCASGIWRSLTSDWIDNRQIGEVEKIFLFLMQILLVPSVQKDKSINSGTKYAVKC